MRQADNDLSIPDQRRQAKAYCASRGWEIAADYVEPHAPGTRVPRAFNGLCDDEGVPLICPTCQVFAQSVLAGARPATLHGVVFDIFVGSHSDAAWLRESFLKPHTPARPLLYRSGAALYDII
jgi:hypothetical protein